MITNADIVNTWANAMLAQLEVVPTVQATGFGDVFLGMARNAATQAIADLPSMEFKLLEDDESIGMEFTGDMEAAQADPVRTMQAMLMLGMFNYNMAQFLSWKDNAQTVIAFGHAMHLPELSVLGSLHDRVADSLNKAVVSMRKAAAHPGFSAAQSFDELKDYLNTAINAAEQDSAPQESATDEACGDCTGCSC